MKKTIDITNLSDRELDALVAEHVMELPEIYSGMYDTGDFGDADKSKPIPHYSTDIAAAWQVVEKFLKDGVAREVGVSILNATTCAEFDEEFTTIGMAVEETTPRAICLAALRTKGVIE